MNQAIENLKTASLDLKPTRELFDYMKSKGLSMVELMILDSAIKKHNMYSLSNTLMILPAKYNDHCDTIVDAILNYKETIPA